MESPLRSVDEQLFKASAHSLPSRSSQHDAQQFLHPIAQLRQQLSAAKASASAVNAAVGAYAREDALAAEEVRQREAAIPRAPWRERISDAAAPRRRSAPTP